MVSLNTPTCNFGWPAPDFMLPGTDGKAIPRRPRGLDGLPVMFICNPCPIVNSILDRLLHDARELLDAKVMAARAGHGPDAANAERWRLHQVAEIT